MGQYDELSYNETYACDEMEGIMKRVVYGLIKQQEGVATASFQQFKTNQETILKHSKANTFIIIAFI